MQQSRGFLVAIGATLLALSVLFVLPFLQYFLLSVALAYLLAPIHERVAARTSRRKGAAVIVGATVVAGAVPVAVVGRVVVREATAVLDQIRRGDITPARVDRFLRERFGLTVDVEGQLQSIVDGLGTGLFDSVVGLFGALTHASFGVLLSLFLLYYFLKDGHRFLSWFRSVVPLPNAVVNDLYAELDGVMWAVFAGHVLVATIQGLIAGLGLFAVGFPNALFWTVVMVVLALLPIVGSFLVWGPAALALFLGGEVLAAVFLTVYGTVVVGLSDNYLRPIVVDRYAKVNPAVIVMGVLGGVYIIGFMGLFFGPVVLAALRATLDVYNSEYQPTELQ